MAHPTPEPHTALLTVAAVRALKADYEADLRLLAELPARVELKKRKLDAAMFFMPDGFDFEALEVHAPAVQPDLVEEPPAAPEAPGRISWAGEMARVLASLEGGIAHKDLLATLKTTELGERVSPGDKGFYNAIGKLAERGLLVKHGGLLYHKDVADRIVARGVALPDLTIELARRKGGSASFVVEALGQHPKGLTAPDIKKIVGAREDAPKSLREHGQYIYNILATLMGNGTVTRRNGVYKLAKKAEGSN